MDTPQIAAAVRKSAGLFSLPSRGTLEVRGSDRLRWLNGIVSNDVRGLDAPENPRCCQALLLDTRGIIQADLHVLGLGQMFWLDVDRRRLPAVMEHLQKYLIADDVEIEDISERFVRWSVEGPKALHVLQGLTKPPLELREGQVRRSELAGIEIVFAGYGGIGEPAAQLFVPARAAASAVRALADRSGPGDLVEANAASREILRVEAGEPDLFAELLPDVLPPEAHLQRVVCTTKGCYIGQEIMARLASRGHVNHVLIQLRFEPPSGSLPAAGASIVCGEPEREEIGQLTSAATSPAHGDLALGYVRRSFAQTGTQVTVEGRKARIIRLPRPPRPSASL